MTRTICSAIPLYALASLQGGSSVPQQRAVLLCEQDSHGSPYLLVSPNYLLATIVARSQSLEYYVLPLQYLDLSEHLQITGGWLQFCLCPALAAVKDRPLAGPEGQLRLMGWRAQRAVLTDEQHIHLA